MKMLIVFKKDARLRFIGHLDLMRTMQRALRRSNLPVRYSQGFNPHMLLNFAAPLSVGIVGEREIMEVPVEGNISAEAFMRIFASVMPVDLPCIDVRLVEEEHPAPMALCRAAEYSCLFETAVEGLEAAIDSFLALEKIPAIRHTKSGDKECDIKPMIRSLKCSGSSSLHMILDLQEVSTCKPDLLLSALKESSGLSLPEYRLIRHRLYGEKNGELIPLESL